MFSLARKGRGVRGRRGRYGRVHQGTCRQYALSGARTVHDKVLKPVFFQNKYRCDYKSYMGVCQIPC